MQATHELYLPKDDRQTQTASCFLTTIIPMSSQHLSPPVFSLPNKKLKMTPPSPPALGPICSPLKGVEEEDGPSVFKVLNCYARTLVHL